MKILHVINSMGSGGAERLISDYLKQTSIPEQHYHYLYLLTKENNVFLKEISNLNVTLKISKRKSVYNPIHFLDLLSYIKQLSPDIVHGHLFPTLYFISMIKRYFPKSKYIFTEHSTQNRRMNMFFLRPIEKMVYKRFNKVIAISEAVRDNLVSWLKFNPKITIINNGIDLNKFSIAKKIDLRSILGIENDSILIAMVASFTYQKNHDSVLEAVAKLPSNTYLLLIGVGPRKNFILNKVLSLNIDNRVIFMGFRPDVAEIYKSVDLALLYSHNEGFGLSALEAIASSTPLVVSDSPGLRDVVKLFKRVRTASTTTELYNMILNLLSDKSDYQDEDLNLLNYYSIEKYTSSINQLYSDLLK